MAIDWARGSFGCKNLTTPVMTFSYVVRNSWNPTPREEYFDGLSEGSKTDPEDFLVIVVKESRIK